MSSAAETAEELNSVEEVVDLFKGLDQQTALTGLIVLVVGLVIAHLLVMLFTRLLERGRIIPKSLHTILKTVVRVLLDLIAVMIAASVIGIPVTSFVAVFSVFGLAVTLGVQGMLSNFVGGVIILVSKPFEVGNFISYDTISGTVKEIGIMHTRLCGPDNVMHYVPNSLLYTSRVTNYSAVSERRIDLTVSASYDSAPGEVRAAVMKAIAAVPGLMSEPAPVIQLETYGDSAITYNIRVWCPAASFIDCKYALNEQLYAAFRESGVAMTYPHVNVHMVPDAARQAGRLGE